MKHTNASPFTRLLLLLALPLLASACRGPSVLPLMPTPVLYSELNVAPLDHIPPEQRFKPRQVYYVTTRRRTPNLQLINYNNKPADRASAGLALIGFGGENISWSDLQNISRSAKREQPVPLSIAGLVEAGTLDLTGNPEVQNSEIGKWLLNELNTSIRTARDQDLMIYVHGAKVNFYNACAFAAQIDHFMGRDMTSMAFSWPTRQSILAYASGADVKRAYRAAPALTNLLELLAKYTPARKIHIVTWSAGGRVVNTALRDLRRRHPDLSEAELKSRFRLGTIYFTAADVPQEDFLEALPDLSQIAEQLVVTSSDNDGALRMANLFMGGGTRIGQVNRALSEEQKTLVLNTPNLLVIDMSLHQETRGFDISGHRYWFDHPWASTDLMLAIRTDLSPAERALEPTPYPILWGIPEDYPDRLRALLTPDIVIRRTPTP